MLTDWSEEKFFANADEYFSSLLVSLSHAQSEILFETYIFKKSQIGDRLIAALNQAAARGVKVRLMVDGVGSVDFSQIYSGLLDEKIHFRIYHPVPWVRDIQYLKSIGEGFFPANFFHLIGSLNSRNHRKMCVIDDRTAFLGSINVADEHLVEVMREKAWCDFGVRVTGGCVEALRHAFEKAWKGSFLEKLNTLSFKKIKRLRRYNRYFMLNHTRKLRKRARNILVTRITESRGRITLMTPYFVPTVRLLAVLNKAAQRGVDVKLILPHKNDVAFMKWVMKVFYDVLLKQGVKIYEYMPSVLHAKVVMIDKWCAIGSTNLNSRSIFHDLESNYILQTDRCKLELEHEISMILKNSSLIKTSRDYPWYERVLGRILLAFRYWI